MVALLLGVRVVVVKTHFLLAPENIVAVRKYLKQQENSLLKD